MKLNLKQNHFKNTFYMYEATAEESFHTASHSIQLLSQTSVNHLNYFNKAQN